MYELHENEQFGNLYIGALRMESQAEKSFRPHLPHPVAYRTVYLCAVKQCTLAEAMACFTSMDRGELAELYRFAAAHHQSIQSSFL